MTYAAKNDERFAGIMPENSEHPLHDDPEFENIKFQALAFEHLFDMAAKFGSYVDHVQKFPTESRTSHVAAVLLPMDWTNGLTIPVTSTRTNSAAYQCFSALVWQPRRSYSG